MVSEVKELMMMDAFEELSWTFGQFYQMLEILHHDGTFHGRSLDISRHRKKISTMLWNWPDFVWKIEELQLLSQNGETPSFQDGCHIVCFHHLFLSASLKNLVDRTEPNFLRIKMYPNKVICEILEEFFGVTAPRKIVRSFEVSEPDRMYA